jgi:hypothetical protein
MIGGRNVEGPTLNLVVVMCYSFDFMCLAAFQWPAGPLNSLFTMTACYRASINAGGFYYGYTNSG